MNYRGFVKILKSKICVFKSATSSFSESTTPVIITDHVKSSQIKNKTPLQL